MYTEDVYVKTIEYYLPLKKNEIMPLATTWMDIEIIILVAKREGTSGGKDRKFGVSRMNKQQGPIVYHRELCSVTYDKW